MKVGPDLITALLAEQHPDLAHLPVRVVAEGWDNLVARLGDDLAVRLPRRAIAAALVEHEIRCLPELAGRLPLPVPVPVRTGRPGVGYPWSWSVVRWVDGDVAARTPPAEPARAARTLGAFLGALHRPAPSDAPVNPFRGIPLARREQTPEQIEAILGGADRGRARQLWKRATSTSDWPGPPVWLHGDLHPGNLVIAGGALASVIDFGDLTAGDPACDLAVGWMMFASPERDVLIASAGHPDPGLPVRAHGWALALSLAYLSGSADDPLIGAIGRRTLAAVLAGDRKPGRDHPR